MARKQRRKRATLDGVKIKIDRAKVHRDSLDRELAVLFPRSSYRIVPEIRDDGRRHIYRADTPPAADPMWSAVVGDCVHNLRSALDHLAYGLCDRPNTRTQFPILDRPPRKRLWYKPWSQRRLLPGISGGVSRDVRLVLEGVQPYTRRDLFHGLGLLRDLDNIDKHRELVLVVTSVSGHVRAYEGEDEPPPSTTHWTRKPLEPGNIVAILTYDRPYNPPDPYLHFTPHIAFGRGGPARGEAVSVVLTDLSILIEDEVVPSFNRFLSYVL